MNFLCTFPVNYECFRKKTGAVALATIASALLNLVLNYVLILRFGMFGAAIATLLAHLIQLTTHELYVRLVLGKKDYPFRMGGWMRYAAMFALAVAVFYLLPEQWLVRWGLGALVGLWEVWRMWQRKGLL